ncbi:MAG: hypothetical protein ABIL58_09105 [Pseudomonadota bacterium]
MHLTSGSATHVPGGTRAWARLKTPQPRGLVFIPPLIGGSAGGTFGRFRWLARSGFDLFSFDYAGHGRSGGAFSLGGSMADSRRMLRIAADQAAGDKLPLYGAAACYGAIPLVSSTYFLGEPLKRAILLNPVPDFSVGAIVSGFRRWSIEDAAEGAPAGRWSRIRQYLDRLFPLTEKGMHGFGLLRRHRTRLVKTLLEAIHFAPLQTLRLRQTPVLCLYARRDVVRQAAGYACERAYRRRVSDFCPGARFYAVDDDHYLATARARRVVRERMRDFLMHSGG